VVLMSEIFATTGTIAAIATAVVPQQGSVGIVRVSGDQAMAIAKTLFHTPGRQVWESHRILYGYIRQWYTCIRETADQVEKIGVERSRRAVSVADLVLFTIDAALF
jgi:tRNA U34 5-carboxymethylaminomethyl modifying GTPase MnmE/TrmE